uniref:Uncharacterized protein n=1 Tax=Babesia bovis TaxID=5865 RepID=S6BNZ3_BABBO|nr:hypothetical protein [Babesia bovis]
MILQAGQITKSKLRAILYRHLDFWGRGRTRQNEMLIDFLTSASCGDMRYAIANLHFYSSVNRTSSKNTGDEMEVLSRLLLERNPSNAVFNVIGKVLVNKRIPVILDDSECDITEDNVLGPSEQGVNSLERFRHCFQLSAPLRVSDCDKEGAVLSLPDDYSDILEILPNLCANISEELLTFEVATESQGDLPPPCSEMLWENMFRSLYENHFDTQLWADMPTDVRLYGLLKPFNKSEPLSFCRWPVIQATPNVEPGRFPRSSHLPLLTRPQMYYNPDELVKNSSIDSVFLVDSLHENYSSYYESIEDCAALTAQLCAADVFASGYRHAGIIGDDLLDDVNTRFACICVRSTSHSNLGGSGVSTQFRALTKGTWHSESKHDMNHLKDLYDQHIRDLASGNQVTSKSITSAYMCKNRAFVELVPFIYMFMYSVPGKHDADMPLFGHIDDVISQPIWERINMIMDEQPCSAPEQMKSNATMPVGMLSSITPKLKEVLSELSKHYDSNFTHVQT